MCELGTILTLAGSVVGAFGQMQAANAQAAAAEYNAKVEEQNAVLAERRARDAIERGTIEEQQKRLQIARLRGQQQAAMAANNVDTGFGSPLDSLIDSKIMGELDALTVRVSAEREAYDYRVQGRNARATAELRRMEARSARSGGFIGAVGTILGGASQAYGGYQRSRIGAIA